MLINNKNKVAYTITTYYRDLDPTQKLLMKHVLSMFVEGELKAQDAVQEVSHIIDGAQFAVNSQGFSYVDNGFGLYGKTLWSYHGNLFVGALDRWLHKTELITLHRPIEAYLLLDHWGYLGKTSFPELLKALNASVCADFIHGDKRFLAITLHMHDKIIAFSSQSDSAHPDYTMHEVEKVCEVPIPDIVKLLIENIARG